MRDFDIVFSITPVGLCSIDSCYMDYSKQRRSSRTNQQSRGSSEWISSYCPHGAPQNIVRRAPIEDAELFETNLVVANPPVSTGREMAVVWMTEFSFLKQVTLDACAVFSIGYYSRPWHGCFHVPQPSHAIFPQCYHSRGMRV